MTEFFVENGLHLYINDVSYQPYDDKIIADVFIHGTDDSIKKFSKYFQSSLPNKRKILYIEKLPRKNIFWGRLESEYDLSVSSIIHQLSIPYWKEVAKEGKEEWTVIIFGKKNLDRLTERLSLITTLKDFKYETIDIQEFAESSFFSLPPSAINLINDAYNLGFYEWPRKASLDILSQKYDISKAGMLKKIRDVNGAGEKLKIIEETLDLENSFSIKRLGSEMKIYKDEKEVPGYEILDMRYPIFNILTYPAHFYDERSGKWKLLLQINPGLAKGEPQTTIELDKKLTEAFETIYSNLFNDIYFLRYNPERAKTPFVLGSILSIDGFGIFSGLQNAYSATGSKLGGYLDYFLDEFNLRMKFQQTEFQTVIMKLIENGLEIEPPAIPDGYLKTITILYLLDLKP